MALAAACGDDDGSSASPAVQGTATTATAGTSSPTEGVVVDLDVAGGQPVGGALAIEADVGEQVTLRFRADVPDEVHVHGYDLTVAVGPGEPGELTFVADIPGQFEIELHDTGAVVAELAVS